MITGRINQIALLRSVPQADRGGRPRRPLLHQVAAGDDCRHPDASRSGPCASPCALQFLSEPLRFGRAPRARPSLSAPLGLSAKPGSCGRVPNPAAQQLLLFGRAIKVARLYAAPHVTQGYMALYRRHARHANWPGLALRRAAPHSSTAQPPQLVGRTRAVRYGSHPPTLSNRANGDRPTRAVV